MPDEPVEIDIHIKFQLEMSQPEIDWVPLFLTRKYLRSYRAVTVNFKQMNSTPVHLKITADTRAVPLGIKHMYRFDFISTTVLQYSETDVKTENGVMN